MNAHDDRRDDARAVQGDALDRRARAVHAGALEALSPCVQAQLAQRRRALLASDASTRVVPLRWGWIGATAAAVCVLTVALQLRPADEPAVEAPRAIALAQADATDPGGVLAEDPDFYLWLASNEAPAYAVE